jgi:hypothetical protein
MKQTVNASVLTIRTDHAFFELPSSEAMFLSPEDMHLLSGFPAALNIPRWGVSQYKKN